MKIYILLVIVILGNTSIYAQNENAKSLKGDVNRDGAINVADVVKIIDVMTKMSGDACQLHSADVNGDGNVDVHDISTVIEIINNRDFTEEKEKYTTINVSRDGTSCYGRTIHFSGLTAIADAINSITDASKDNRYVIHIEGEFKFTDPLTVPMFGGNEYSIIFMKDYVDIEGDGPDKSAIIMDFPANATFHDGMTYSDYQPIYFYTGGHRISNMKIVGKNCRYAFHIEAGAGSQDKTIDIENCEVEYLGHPDYRGSYGDCFGTGMNSGQVWNIEKCILRYHNGNAFAMHTPLSLNNSIRPGVVNMVNCTLDGSVALHNYQVENKTFLNFYDCIFGLDVPLIRYPIYNNRVFAKTGNYITVLTNGTSVESLYYCGDSDFNKGNILKGAVLRIVSLSTGTSSVVRFDHTSSAFFSIIGDGIAMDNDRTFYGWNTNYGYVWRDGGSGFSGRAFGTLDVDETASNNVSLAKLLGDCSIEPKFLNVSIDGTDYTVVFNEDYKNKDNAYVLSRINSVIDGAGVADVFSPALLYYPNINGLTERKCDDGLHGSILRGQGVVFTENGARRAKNSDGYIDGIALDDIAAGQLGRFITNGYIFNQTYRNANYNAMYFTTLDNSKTQKYNGITAGIDPNNDGFFLIGQSPVLLSEVYAPLIGVGFGAFKIQRKD